MIVSYILIWLAFDGGAKITFYQPPFNPQPVYFQLIVSLLIRNNHFLFISDKQSFQPVENIENTRNYNQCK